MEDLGKGSILTFSARTTILAGMKQLVRDGMLHGPAPEEDTDKQVEVGFKKMDDAKPI